MRREVGDNVDATVFSAERYRKLEEDFTELVKRSEHICDYCKNKVQCKGEECDKYMKGNGCEDEKGNHYDWDWTCEDFDFGTCDMMIDTPCNGCFKNDNNGFEWRGNE
nr:MAG TPA: hypothetical protein [Caudoviricetes sp.]